MIKTGFIGAGGIAHAHAYALQSLKFFYREVPEIVLESVCSMSSESRMSFAGRYGFNHSQDLSQFIKNKEINTVFILGPNNTHFQHLKMALEMPGVERIYLEKPVCATIKEEMEMADLFNSTGKCIQVGFQFLQTPAIREGLKWWQTGVAGIPVHFELKYYHGDYLQESYRLKRQSRLQPAPDGGAMADLGCHGLSLLVAFLGKELFITGALQGGAFPGVPEGSDLFSTISLFDRKSKAVGTLSASRISSGSGDLVTFELFAGKGAFRYSTETPDSYSHYLESDKCWVRNPVGSNYLPITSFPSGHVPAGWLRSLVHAHYLFLGGSDPGVFIPDLSHGLAVQRLVRETAEHMKVFRENSLTY